MHALVKPALSKLNEKYALVGVGVGVFVCVGVGVFDAVLLGVAVCVGVGVLVEVIEGVYSYYYGYEEGSE